jgi:hypothetical protein
MAQMGWGVHSREKKEFGIQIIRQQQPVHIGPFVPYREVIVALVFAFTHSRISNNKVFATDLTAIASRPEPSNSLDIAQNSFLEIICKLLR